MASKIHLLWGQTGRSVRHPRVPAKAPKRRREACDGAFRGRDDGEHIVEAAPSDGVALTAVSSLLFGALAKAEVQDHEDLFFCHFCTSSLSEISALLMPSSNLLQATYADLRPCADSNRSLKPDELPRAHGYRKLLGHLHGCVTSCFQCPKATELRCLQFAGCDLDNLLWPGGSRCNWHLRDRSIYAMATFNELY